MNTLKKIAIFLGVFCFILTGCNSNTKEDDTTKKDNSKNEEIIEMPLEELSDIMSDTSSAKEYADKKIKVKGYYFYKIDFEQDQVFKFIQNKPVDSTCAVDFNDFGCIGEGHEHGEKMEVVGALKINGEYVSYELSYIKMNDIVLEMDDDSINKEKTDNTDVIEHNDTETYDNPIRIEEIYNHFDKYKNKIVTIHAYGAIDRQEDGIVVSNYLIDEGYSIPVYAKGRDATFIHFEYTAEYTVKGKVLKDENGNIYLEIDEN